MGVYEELKVRRVINASGTLTRLGGSLIETEVLEAMNDAATSFVYMDELMEKTGEVIAEITGAEMGLVTAGGAAALVLAAAACMTGKDLSRIAKLPDTSGMKNEIIIQRMHRNIYDRCLTSSGARLVEVGYRDRTSDWEIEAAINEKTSAIVYFVYDPQPGVIPLKQVIRIAKKHGVPVIVDAAAELPPVENLQKFIAMGADLVVFSGGKDIGGPNDSGILCGRKDLVEAARLNAFPSYSGHYPIGRTMKISKEQIVGLIFALKMYVKKDHLARMKRWTEMVDYMTTELNTIPHVEAKVIMPEGGAIRPLCISRTEVRLDETKLAMTVSEAVNLLRSGNPVIEVYSIQEKNVIQLIPQCLADGQEKIVVERLKEVLTRPKDYATKS